MKVTVTVMNANDISIKSKTDKATGVMTQSGTFKALVFDPMNLLTIQLTEQHILDKVPQRLLEKAGQPQDILIDYQNMGFAGEGNQHVQINRMVFVDFPSAGK